MFTVQLSTTFLFICANLYLYTEYQSQLDMFMATTTWIWPFKALLNPLGSPEHLQKKKYWSWVSAFWQRFLKLFVSWVSYHHQVTTKGGRENKNDCFFVARNGELGSHRVVRSNNKITSLDLRILMWDVCMMYCMHVLMWGDVVCNVMACHVIWCNVGIHLYVCLFLSSKHV